MDRKFRGQWRFTRHASPMTFWSEGERRAGGVGILLNPYLTADAKPALEELWSPHFVAITCSIEDSVFMLINVYAPSVRREREAFYATLVNYTLSHDGSILTGGDFNCTQHWQLDRSHEATARRHVSQGLTELLDRWSVADALVGLISEDLEQTAIDDFHRQHHTYQYKIGQLSATSRLDRWYLNGVAREWFRLAEPVRLGGETDHLGVSLSISDPTRRVRARPRRKVYPPRRCAEDAVRQVCSTMITELRDAFADLETRRAETVDFIQTWVTFKRALILQMDTATKDARRKTRAGFRLKVTRLRRAIQATNGADGDREPLVRLQTELCMTLAQWAQLKSRRRAADAAWGSSGSCARFYNRISSRSASSNVTNLNETPGLPPRAVDDGANRMADAWRDVFTEPHTAHDRPLFGYPRGATISETEATALDQHFTLAEVVAAIKRCKATKSGGPDGLPNAWYRDYLLEISPVLLSLYHKCYESGHYPASFQDATVVCIPKAGRSVDPLAYRPISLLNTDYKVFTKILTARLKPMLSSLVEPVQGGFVPGRNIHHVIDVFAAAQALAQQNDSKTVAVLLDIKKAYDSINRPFLFRSLAERGFPAKFMEAMRNTHSSTTARFRVNGFLSERVPMTRGIRQGCPMAPLLFILAIDPLYRRLLREPDLSEPFPECPTTVPTVGGFADDTGVYLSSEDAVPVLEKC